MNDTTITPHPIAPPATYVAPFAAGYADENGNCALVSQNSPLPTASTRRPAPAALSGETALSMLAGPFRPAFDRPVHLLLDGEWSGEVIMRRSTDGGVTHHALTAGGLPWGRYSANANEVVWQEGEDGAALYLDIALTSGIIAYRVSQ